MHLSGKRIVLTGAASGIGRALLGLLREYDVAILAVDINAEGLQRAVFECRDGRARVKGFVADLRQQDQVDAVFEEALKEFGDIDIFFANAGFAYYEVLHNPDWNHIEQIYRLNVFSVLYTVLKMKALNPAQPYRVVVTASAMGLLAIPGYALYASTKAALIRFAQAYRHELDDPCQLTLVYPIGTRTGFFQAASGTPAPHPFPTQRVEGVAKAILRGIQRDKKDIYPSLLFRVFYAATRVLPFLADFEQWIEKRRLVKWLLHQGGQVN